MAYLPPAQAIAGTRLQVECFGDTVPGDRGGGRRHPAVRPGQRPDPELDRAVEIAVCVKRVPQVGGRIVVTPDGRDVDTRMSGFAISPHEECAVEEAVQITERLGGSVVGAHPGTGRGRRPAARHARARRQPGRAAGRRRRMSGARPPPPPRSWPRHAAGPPRGRAYDLLLLGNEAADTGGLPGAGAGGARARAGRAPPASSTWRSTGAGGAAPEREYRGHEEIVRVRAARGDQRQGRHQPAPLSLAAGTAAGQAGGHRAVPAAVAARGTAQAGAPGAGPAAAAGDVLGTGTDAVPALVRLLDELGV